MADLPFLVELNEQNLTETLQRSVETPLVINFMRQAIKNQLILQQSYNVLQNNIKDNLFSA